MKYSYLYLTFLIVIGSICSFCTKNVDIRTRPNVEEGEYYIVNASTGDALTPVDVGVNSNTRLKPFKKSGLQKWTIKKRIVKGTTASQVFFTIQNTASGFYLRPYHIPDNGNAIISTKDDMCEYKIEANGNNHIIKNVKMGGDALYVKDGGALTDEPWFAADEGNEKFRWEFKNASPL